MFWPMYDIPTLSVNTLATTSFNFLLKSKYLPNVRSSVIMKLKTL